MEIKKTMFSNRFLLGKTRLSIDELLNECQVDTPPIVEKEGDAGKSGIDCFFT